MELTWDFRTVDKCHIMAVERHFRLNRLFDLAVEKDRGFSPGVFTQMLGRFGRLARTELPLDDIQFEALSQTRRDLGQRVRIWRTIAMELTPREERSRGVP
ncbi:MAG: hypothetical protein ACRDYE_07135 [Acidimicrobiales bacterium]